MMCGEMADDDALKRWLTETLDDPGPFELTPLSGGNSNETVAVTSPQGRWILRRPPAASLAPGAHAMEREHRIMQALSGRPVPTPRALGVLVAEGVPQTPALLMEHIDGVALTDTLPDGYPDQPEAARQIGEAVIDALADLHSVPYREAGLEGFGKPEGFLERQVPRWRKQLDRYKTRDLPRLDELTAWLEGNRPPSFEPGIMHGDFHLDNCLLTPEPPIRVAAIVDWEMATIGDPLLDLGLFLAFWGERSEERPAMPRVQGVSRVPGSPPPRGPGRALRAALRPLGRAPRLVLRARLLQAGDDRRGRVRAVPRRAAEHALRQAAGARRARAAARVGGLREAGVVR